MNDGIPKAIDAALKCLAGPPPADSPRWSGIAKARQNGTCPCSEECWLRRLLVKD